ncbi:MAG: hypothetical protein Q9160_008852 [Pyrenula sp. 1 TL-2023]
MRQTPLEIKDNKLKAGNLDTEALLMFYTILSAGMCLVAVNLPSIWFLFTKAKIPEKVLESIRSLISLGSSLGGKDGDRSSGTVSKKGSGEAVRVNGIGNGNGKVELRLNEEVGGWELHALPAQHAKEDLESGNGDVIAVPANAAHWSQS